MCCPRSWVILLIQKHGSVVEQVRIWLVSVDQQDFGNVPSARPSFEVDDNIEGIGNVRLHGPIREVHTTLQNTTRKPRKSLLRGIRMNGAQCSGMAGI